MRYGLVSYIPEDSILHSHSRRTLSLIKKRYKEIEINAVVFLTEPEATR
jgi:hypothetical protein